MSINFNTAQHMSKQKLLRKLGLNQKYENLILLPLGTVFLLIVFVMIFGLGLDKKLTSSSVSGYIVDTSSGPVDNALVCIENQCKSTSPIGYYRLTNLSPGEKEISVSSVNHNDITQRIRISRGGNSMSLSLTPAELTDAVIQISSIEEILKTEDLHIRISGNEYTPDFVNPDNAEIRLDNFKTGMYFLEISSKYYIDQNVELVLEGGTENIFPIILEPATKFSLNILDWLNDEPINRVTVEVNGQIFGETTVQGRINLEEIPVGTKEIRLSKEGYLRQILKLENLSPGESPEITSKLIPDKKIVYTKSSASGKQVFLSNYDGSGKKQLTTSGINHNPWIDEQNERVYFSREVEDNRNSIHYIDFYGEETETLSSDEKFTKREIGIIDYKNDLRFYLEQNEEQNFSLFYSRLDDNSVKVIFKDRKSKLDNLLSSNDGSTVVYKFIDSEESREEEKGIFVTTTRFNRTRKILNQISQTAIPQAISDDNKYLAVTIENDIFIYNLSDKSLERVTSDTVAKTSIQFLPKQKALSYVLEGKLVILDPESQETELLSLEDVMISKYRWESLGVFSYRFD